MTLQDGQYKYIDLSMYLSIYLSIYLSVYLSTVPTKTARVPEAFKKHATPSPPSTEIVGYT